MSPNNDDILAIVLAERGEGEISLDPGAVASDPRSAKAYREFHAIADMARAARSSEQAWRDRAVSRTVESIQSHSGVEFRSFRPRRTALRGAALAAAAVLCIAVGAALLYNSQQPAAPLSTPVASQTDTASELPATFHVAVAKQHDALPGGFGEFRSLAEGIDSAAVGSTLQIKASNSAEVMRLSKPVKVLAVGGTVRIGARQ